MHLKFDNRLFTWLFYTGVLLAVGVYCRRAGDVRVLHATEAQRLPPGRMTSMLGLRRPMAVPGEPRGLPARRLPHRRVRLHGQGDRPAVRCAPASRVVRTRQVVSFVAAMILLFVASTWPIHQFGEEYLYSVHMVQHMILSYFMPPLVLLATPEWLLRTLIGEGRAYSALRVLTNRSWQG